MIDIDEMQEAQRRAERNRKIAKMKREKELAELKRRILLRIVLPIIVVILLIVIGVVLASVIRESREKRAEIANIETVNIETETITEETTEEEEKVVVAYEYTEADTVDFLSGENMQSEKAILVNIDTNQIVGQVDYKARMIPASMTKVMTVLVAAEHLDMNDVNRKVNVSIDATDFAYRNDCSSVGFLDGETVTIEDLFYGTILCSGGDAAAQLAIEVSGTQEEFVELMNKKCEELGISETTHFTNTVGLYNDDHYSTCYDMAVIMNAAIENEYLKKVMNARKYTTSKTTEHPEGISISNWFLRKIEDKDSGGEVTCAKTGFVKESRNCAVSYMEVPGGYRYICVTVGAHSGWRCIYDHVDIYKNHATR